MNSLSLFTLPSLDTTALFDPAHASLITKKNYDLPERRLVALYRSKRNEVAAEMLPQARCSKPPIFLLPPAIDNYFLETAQGKALRMAVQWLLKKEALQEKSEREYYEKLNSKLQNGICKGTAITYLLHSRKSVAGTSQQKQSLDLKIEKRVAALFEQLSATVRIALREYHAKSPDTIAICFDLALSCTAKKPWLEKRISILEEHTVEKREAIVDQIRAVFAKKATAEMLVIFGFEGTTDQHMIALRPGKRKIYDDNFGELYWKSEETMFQALEQYTKALKVTRATIQVL